jgi:Nif-specific regulatory protein
VRELENCLERAAVMSESGSIDAELIQIDRHRESPAAHFPPPAFAMSSGPGMGVSLGNGTPPAATSHSELDERSRVIAALEQAGWVQARAARILGMTPRQIAYRILTLNIDVKKL